MDKFRFTAGPWTLVHDEHGHTLQYDTGYEPSGLPSPPFVVNMTEIEELNDLLYALLRCSQSGERRFFLLTEQAKAKSLTGDPDA